MTQEELDYIKEKQRIANKKYHQSEKGKAALKRAMERYRSTEAGKAKNLEGVNRCRSKKLSQQQDVNQKEQSSQ